MIAHSLPNPFFGPAQNMHGATFVVDVEFQSKNLDPHNVVVDMGFAHKVTKDILAPLNYQNLDELDFFKGKLTTTEFLARYIHDRIQDQTKDIFKGSIKITLGENHIAWASYQGESLS